MFPSSVHDVYIIRDKSNLGFLHTWVSIDSVQSVI